VTCRNWTPALSSLLERRGWKAFSP